MSDFDRRMAQLLDDAVPEPPRTLNPAAIRAAQLTDEGRSRRVRAVLAGAAVVLVVAGIVAVVAVIGGPSRAPLAGGPNNPSGPQASADATMAGPGFVRDSPRESTIHAVDRLLAQAPALPDAIPSADAPVAALRQPPFTPGETNLVRRTKWATASGTVRHALDYFATHLPAGFTQGRSSHSGGGGAQVYSRSFDAGPGWQRPDLYTGLEITISAVRTATAVAIRIDADAAWLTPQLQGSYIPGYLIGARVVIRREGFAPTVRRTLTVPDAAALAHVINDLHVPTSAQFSCPATFPGHQDDLLVFETRHGAVRVDIDADGCRSVAVHNGRVNQQLFGYLHGTTVDRRVLQLIGLPPDYGRH